MVKIALLVAAVYAALLNFQHLPLVSNAVNAAKQIAHAAGVPVHLLDDVAQQLQNVAQELERNR